MVDLSKLKAGDTVHFRCGGKAEVFGTGVSLECKNNKYPIAVYLNGFGGELTYAKDGDCGKGTVDDCPFDIIRVEPAFRWEDVRPGMAFFDYARDILFYIGPDFEGGAVFSLEMSVSDETTWFVNKEDLKDLTPAPEHNIEVAK